MMGALTPSASVVLLTWLSTSPVEAALSAAGSMALYQNDTGALDRAGPSTPLGGCSDGWASVIASTCSRGFRCHTAVLMGLDDALPAAHQA